MTLEEEYRLSCYEELTTLGNHNHIYLVKHKLSGEIFVKKVLSRFSLDVYKQLRDLQIPGIPIIHDLILENDSLILIEDYIHGQTLEQLLEEQTTLVYSDALAIMRKLCDVLKSLHALTPPIIHRDLKLSNIILTSNPCGMRGVNSASFSVIPVATSIALDPGDWNTAKATAGFSILPDIMNLGRNKIPNCLERKNMPLQNSMDLGSLMPDLIFMHWGLFLTAY